MADVYKPREWLPHERPMLPGSPSTPLHSMPRRMVYLLVGILITITGGLGNALVVANLQNLQGVLGATSVEIAWLPAAYMMTNLSINLLLVKVRQQFGLRLFAEPLIALYALICFAHLFAHDFSTAMAVRAAHGIAGAALTTLGFLYMIQGFPQKIRLNGLVLAIGVSQLAMPMARLFSADLLEIDEWRGLYTFELGLALLSLAAVLWLKLPPSDRTRVFEKKDFLTFSLFAPGMALLAAVLSLGRYVWWLEAPWVGVCLALGIALIAAALWVEHRRDNPLIDTRWLSGWRIARIFMVIILIRIIATEQSTGAVGFMQSFGLTNEQLDGLFQWVMAGTVLGMFVSAAVVHPKRLIFPVLAGVGLMGAAALMDAFATNVTRPENLYASQFLMAFGATLCIGPSMVAIISDVIPRPRVFVSFVAMFGLSQNLGGLIGGALVGTFQISREKYHSSQLTEHMTMADPNVAGWVHQHAAAYGGVLTDPALIQAQGLAALKAATSREANILAYNDSFMMIFGIACLTFAWVLYRMIRLRLDDRKAAQA